MQSSKDGGPSGGIGASMSQSDGGKLAAWKDNIHLTETHEDPMDKQKLAEHNKMLAEHDKFIDFINHVENSKQQKREKQLNEIISIGAQAGKPSSSYLDLNFAAGEWEEELEQRDFTTQAKSTQPVTISHSQYACIGSDSAFKQKSIRKLFVYVLQDLKKAAEKTTEDNGSEYHDRAASQGSNGRSSPTSRKLQESFAKSPGRLQTGDGLQSATRHGHSLIALSSSSIPLNEHLAKQKDQEKQSKHTVEFMKLMDYIKEQKRAQKNEQLFRQNYRKRSTGPAKNLYQAHTFIENKGAANASQYIKNNLTALKSPQRAHSAMKTGPRNNIKVRELLQAASSSKTVMTHHTQMTPGKYTYGGETEKRTVSQLSNKFNRTGFNGSTASFKTPKKAARGENSYGDAIGLHQSFLSGNKSGNKIALKPLTNTPGLKLSQNKFDDNSYFKNETPEQRALLGSSHTRLQVLINEENAKIHVHVEQKYSNFTFKIPQWLEKKVPRHWLTFVDDVHNELREVTSSVYDGGVSKGQRNGQGQIVYPNGDVYRGNWKNNERSGFGVCKFHNGAIFKGEFKYDRPQGLGTLFCPPNELIEGKFDNWQLQNSQMKILFTNGEFYEGNFERNQRNSTGVHYYRNGDYFDGDWEKDKRIKNSRLYQADGSVIHGQFTNDQADGNVEFEDSEGNVFQSVMIEDKNPQQKKGKKSKKQEEAVNEEGFKSGTFYKCKLLNLGVVNYKNGDKFRGNFKDGRPCGRGTMKYNYSLPGSGGAEYEEATYEGLWKAGKREGYGEMKWNDGQFYKGIWKGDKRFQGEMSMASGNVFIGPFKEDIMHGRGRLLLASGIIFDGVFENGVCSAVGKLLYPNGDLYYGQHKVFSKEGQGKLIFFDSSIYEGGWENDRKNGKGRFVDAATGDIYVGDYNEGKRSGRGRMYVAAKQEIYDGEWSNDRRQGEGTIVNQKGEIASGEFRADNMEGKLTYQKSLSPEETQRVFMIMQKSRDVFISVENKKGHQIESEQSPRLATASKLAKFKQNNLQAFPTTQRLKSGTKRGMTAF